MITIAFLIHQIRHIISHLQRIISLSIQSPDLNFKMAATVPQLIPLPNIEGPKLKPFVQNIDNHNFVLEKFLGGGCHSAVVLASIDGKQYAIKFVSIITHPCVSY